MAKMSPGLTQNIYEERKEKTHRSFSCDFIHDRSQASFIIQCFE